MSKHAEIQNEEFLSIGTMSGTSMDGIDVALLKTDGVHRIEEIEHASLEYDREFHLLLKAAEYAVHKNNGNIEALGKEDFSSYFKEYITEILGMKGEEAAKKWRGVSDYLPSRYPDASVSLSFRDIIGYSTELHARAVKILLDKSGYLADQIDLIGYHGQTLYHKPQNKITVEIGDGQKLAYLTGITVINDFRRRDINYGGQGAPFAPLYHQALAIRDQNYPLAIVNCGGIANITIIKGLNDADLLGFDTGPGNGLIDLYIKRETSFKKTMDENGQYGSRGIVDPEILQKLYEKSVLKDGHNYLEVCPPKSLDINDLVLISDLHSLRFEDACRTLEALTAECIVRSLDLVPGLKPRYWVLAGGGWNNPVIKNELIERLEKKYTEQYDSPLTINTAEEVGWKNKALEAQIFAYLSIRSLLGKPISIPQTTRVPYPLSGGHAYLSDRGSTDKVRKALENNPDVLKGYINS